MRTGTPVGVFQQKHKSERRLANLLQGLPKGVGKRKERRERDKANLLKICQEEINGNSGEDGRKDMWYEKAEARAYLEALPDSEILAELRRRGYIGRLYKKIEVVL